MPNSFVNRCSNSLIGLLQPRPLPGDLLLRLPDAGVDLAALPLQVPTNRITEILNGHRAITGDTALRLAHFFGTSAEFWLNLQKLYELRLAEKKAGKAIKTLPTLKNEHVHF